MERKETITLEQFKKEFKAWNQLTIRMPRCNMVFTKHFVKQLHEVLSFYDETEGHNAPGSALFDVLRWDLRKIIKSPIKESYPTTNPKVRYVMPFDINVTFHYDLEALTVLSICTDSWFLYHYGYNFKENKKIYTRFGIIYEKHIYLCTR